LILGIYFLVLQCYSTVNLVMDSEKMAVVVELLSRN